MTGEEGKGELPEGWVRTSVGEIYKIIGGGTPSTRVPEYWEGDIPWITSADIHGLKQIKPRKYINENAIKRSATNLIPKDSIIVVTRVGLGKVALTKKPICFSQDSQALIGNKELISPDYSLYYLSEAVQIFKYKHRGTTIAGVTKKQLKELHFPPPSPRTAPHRRQDRNTLHAAGRGSYSPHDPQNTAQALPAGRPQVRYGGEAHGEMAGRTQRGTGAGERVVGEDKKGFYCAKVSKGSPIGRI